jgi:uncharacterized protein YyaL (SSP411 family)
VSERPSNRLAGEASPYLLQHAGNPVDWYPWGEEAIAAARAADLPLFLSVGYSACHWCHVMERESFEDPDTARLMNELFINVKVDREERPDLDEIYMQAVQLFTGGHGGWPMSVFLTPALEPYLGGTYFPPEDRHGMPGFRTVLQFAARAYRERREDVAHTTSQVVTALRDMAVVEPDEAAPGVEVLAAAAGALARSFDPHDGGFGGAPKFPHAMGLGFLLRWHNRSGEEEALRMVRHSLRRMARGGIHDQLGGGFHRYSVDAHWLVPHFEKMLYDNALLARAYLEGWQASGDADFRQVASDILDYVGREMTSPEGAFYAAQDADSEGVEGKFFVWTPAEIAAAIGADAARVVCCYYDVTEQGNFEHGMSVLSIRRDPDVVAAELGMELDTLQRIVTEARPRLLRARTRRVPPARDDKIIVAWNGLMISALARAHQVWGDRTHLQRATAAAEFVIERSGEDGAVFRTAAGGRARDRGFLDDHASFFVALLDLFEASFEPRWIEAAMRLESFVREEFGDEVQGGYYFSGRGHEALLARTRQPFDNATPSGNALMAGGLLRLAALTGDAATRQRAERTLHLFGISMRRAPSGMAEMLSALDLALGPQVQVAIAGRGEPAAALARAVRSSFVPRLVVAGWPAEGEPARLALLEQRGEVNGRPAAYVCRDFTCKLPELDPAALARAVAEASQGG